jgi:hypothetical protein
MKAKNTLRNCPVKWFVPLSASLMVAANSSGALITFDGLADSELVTTQFSGGPEYVTFANAIVLTQGISLNDAEFPPVSLLNVVADNGGPMTITFGSAATHVEGYFTYAFPLALQFFGDGGTLLGTVSSTFSENFVSSGNPSNEFIQFSSPAGIRSVMITGSPTGNSFALDNLRFTVPEPGSTLPVLMAFAVPLLHRRGRRAGSRQETITLNR